LHAKKHHTARRREPEALRAWSESKGAFPNPGLEALEAAQILRPLGHLHEVEPPVAREEPLLLVQDGSDRFRSQRRVDVERAVEGSLRLRVGETGRGGERRMRPCLRGLLTFRPDRCENGRQLALVGQREPQDARLTCQALGKREPRGNDHEAAPLRVEAGEKVSQPPRHIAVLEFEVEIEHHAHRRLLATTKERIERGHAAARHGLPRIEPAHARPDGHPWAPAALEGDPANGYCALLLVAHDIDDARAGSVQLRELLDEGHGERPSRRKRPSGRGHPAARTPQGAFMSSTPPRQPSRAPPLRTRSRPSPPCARHVRARAEARPGAPCG